MTDLRPKAPRLKLCHFRVGELHTLTSGPCLADLRPKSPQFWLGHRQQWTSLSSLSYNHAYVPEPMFGSMFSKAHLAHIALWADDQHRQAGIEPRIVPDLLLPSTSTIIRSLCQLTLCQVLSGGRQRQISVTVLRTRFFSVLSGIRAGRSMLNGRLKAKRPLTLVGWGLHQWHLCPPRIALELAIQFKL